MRAIVDNNGYDERIRALADRAGVGWPPTEENIYTAKKKRKREEADTWMECHAQGMGVKDFRGDKIGNAWLSNPELLKSTRYISAIHMRTNTFGTRVAMARAYKGTDVTCRRCREQTETLGHVLGQCIYMKPARIRRHDDLVEFLADKLSVKEL